jgi:hypothetical protein
MQNNKDTNDTTINMRWHIAQYSNGYQIYNEAIPDQCLSITAPYLEYRYLMANTGLWNITT